MTDDDSTDEELKLENKEPKSLRDLGMTDGWLLYIRPLLKEKIAGAVDVFLTLKEKAGTPEFEHLRGAAAFAIELIKHVEERPDMLQAEADEK